MMQMGVYTGVSLMRISELIASQGCSQAIAELRLKLERNPGDLTAVEGMAKALRASGAYRQSLSYFQRLQNGEMQNAVANALAPGRIIWNIDIACLHWLMDEHPTAIALMYDLAAGTLNGSVRYGDAAGGISQGLLLYYMALTDHASSEASFALEYLRDRVSRIKPRRVWPCPVAEYLLAETKIEAVMEAVHDQSKVVRLDIAKSELATRRRLCVAIFYAGVIARAAGNEPQCIARMHECNELDDPLLEQEWYLARYEIQKTQRGGTH